MSPATDLGYLVHKHPDRAQSFDVGVGTAQVFWPEATAERSTIAMLVEVDPIGLVRGRGGRATDGFTLGQYVNDRPYAASSLLAVAIGKVFRTALTGRCDARPDLAGRPLPLEVHLPAVPSRGGSDLVTRLFGPLGWQVTATPIPLDPELPEWGDSPYVNLRLNGTLPMADALSHLYVLLPVLDDSKHYWVGSDEVDKLLRAGGTWLGDHPERDLITRRYLRHSRPLVFDATTRLAEIDDSTPDHTADSTANEPPDLPARPRSPLAQARTIAVLEALRSEGATTVVDLGCGEGNLLRELLADPAYVKILGVDVSPRSLELAVKRLQLDRLPDAQRARIQLIQSSLTYRDDRLAGYDAAVLMEVIEHLDPPRLPALERSVFGVTHPTCVLVTTPNADYNVRFDSLPAGSFRHPDHRFEWTREQFRAWGDATAGAYGYSVRFLSAGPEDPEVGPPTQLAVFRRKT